MRRLPRILTLSRLMKNAAWTCGLSAVFVGGALLAGNADEAPVGLAGVLPAASPADLEGALGSFPENWTPWATAVQAELNQLYTESGTVAQQRETLAKLRRRLATCNQYLADPRYRSLNNLLTTLRGGLKRRLDVAEAVLGTMDLPATAWQSRQAQTARDVTNAAVSLSNNLNSVSTGAGWKTYLKLSDLLTALNTRDGAKINAAAAETQTLLANAPTDEVTQKFVARPDFVALRNALANHAGAVAGGAEGQPQLRQVATDLLNAIERHEEEPSSEAGKAVRNAYARLAAVTPDGGARIVDALRSNYFNHNIRLFAPESFLNRFISETRRDSSGINEQVEEAQVSGAQTTYTTVGVDVQPSANSALMTLVVNGNVASNTLASTDQAQVSIYGTARFNAQKSLYFDGERFAFGQTMVGAQANNQITNIDTKYDGIPIIRRIAQNKAWEVAGSRQAEGEAMVVNRIRGMVASQLDGQINQEFGPTGEVPTRLNTLISALRRKDLFPSPLQWSSTNTDVRMSGRVMGAAELGGTEPDLTQVNPRGVTLMVHQSAVNNGLDRLGFAGQTLSDDELVKKLQGHLSDLLGKPVDLMSGKPKKASDENAARMLAFDGQDPVRVAFIDDTIELTIRAGLKQEGREEIPPHLIRVPLTVKAVNEGILLTPGNVSVETIDKQDSQAVRAGVIKKKIEEAIPEQLLKRSMSMQRGNRMMTLAVTRLRAVDGWLTVWVE
ncbi:MAG: hypothetical protein ACK5HA_10910 [Planctomycetaceae bacterium]|jgi:hypothetical protein